MEHFGELGMMAHSVAACWTRWPDAVASAELGTVILKYRLPRGLGGP